MGKSAPSPPPAPDYAGAAVAQGDANLKAGVQSSVLSNPNTTGPLGNQTVSYSNITGPDGQTYLQPNVSQSLTPEAQQTLEAQQQTQLGLSNLGNQALGTASGIIGQQFNPQNIGIQGNLGNYGQAQTGLNTTGIAAMPVNAGATGQQALMSRLQPEINQSNAALAQQLANQGITGGSEAYNNAQRVQGQNNNDLVTQAALQGINLDMSANQQGYNQALQSGQFANSAQNQNFNQALSAGQFANTAANQNLQQQLGLYNQPLNQIAALESGSQIQMPQFQGYTGSQVAAAPIANATTQLGQYQQGLYGQQMAGYNSQMQGIGSLLGAGASILAAPATGGGSLAAGLFGM